MIEAIREIGRYAIRKNLDRDIFLDGICRRIDSKKKNKKGEDIVQYVLILDFDTSKKNIKLDIEPINVDSGKKYLWIGNADANKPKIYITENKMDNLLTEILPEIGEKAKGQLKQVVQKVIDEFFAKKIEKENKKEKVYYFVKPQKFLFFPEKVKKIQEKSRDIKHRIASADTKTDIDKIVEGLNKLWEETTGKKLEKKEIKEIGKENPNKIIKKCDELLHNINDKLVNKYNFLDGNEKEKKKPDILIKDIVSLQENFHRENMGICTIKINGNLICQMDGYKQMVYDEKITVLFDKNNKEYKSYFQKGICSICSDDVESAKETTSNPTNLDFKFYIQDKVGFSSNLDGKFTKNYNICKKCYQYLMVAENYIMRNLRSKIGNMSVYIIPHFILKVANLEIDEFSEYIKFKTDSITRLKSFQEFQNELSRFTKYEADKKNNFIINYLFYQSSGKSDFKVLRLIKDVPPGRLDFIKEKEDEIDNLVDSNFGKDGRLKVDLDQIWGCIPIKKVKNNYLGVAKYLDILDAIFSERKIDYDFLIKQFVEVIRIIKFETAGYNIWIKQDFIYKNLQLNLLLLFFKKLNLLKGGRDMNSGNDLKQCEVSGMIPKEIMDYWKKLEIYTDDTKKALFLLGYLIGEIGSKQSGKGMKKKPILNKINFQGMGTEKLKRLINEIPDKLRQYDVLQYNENNHNACKLLMEQSIDDWGLSNQENVFYTLSGYAFSGFIGWKRYKESLKNDIKNLDDEIKKEKGAGKDVTKEEDLLKKASELFYGDNKDYGKVREILKQIKTIKEGKENEQAD